MSSRDYLPHAAIVLYGAMVAITAWLSYRRIVAKYPQTKAKQDAAFGNTELKRP
jgi:hypothetical protein